MSMRCGRYRSFAMGLALLGFALSTVPADRAWAEASKVRVATQFGLAYLPLIVMEHDKLWEKYAKARGLDVEVEYTRLGGGATLNDALISGSVELVAGGVPPMLGLWDRTRNNLGVRGLSGLNISPIFLLSNRPDVASLKDLSAEDRIAVPSIRLGSIQSILLRMAAEKTFGPSEINRFDANEVAMQHPDAYAALLSGGTQVTGYFSSSPFQERALQNPRIRKIADSFEIQGGPATFSLVWTTAKFVKDNPKLIEAYFAALDEAVAGIKSDKEASIDKYVKVTADKTERALLRSILDGPSFAFDIAPNRTMPIADFMARVGLIKTTPKSWKDYFFEVLHDKSGS